MINCRLKRNKEKLECQARSKSGRLIIDLMVHIVVIWIISLLVMPLFTMGLLWTFIGVFIISVALLLAEIGIDKALEGR